MKIKQFFYFSPLLTPCDVERHLHQVSQLIPFFVTALYGLAQHYQFGTLHDEPIRDRIVVGLLDQNLSERLQLIGDLILDKAIRTPRQSEAVKK